MKNSRFFLLALLTVFIASCNQGGNNITHLFPAKLNDHAFGYIDRTGKTVINPSYAEAACFSDGLALVAEVSGEKAVWGYIDETGKYIVSPKYDFGTSYSEGLAMVVADTGAPAAIDKSGAVKFTMQDAEQVGSFYNGLAAFSIVDEQGEKWGFIDQAGKTVIAPKYFNVGYFSEGLCGVMNEDGKWGFINKKGDLAIDYKYNIISAFYWGVAKVAVDSSWGIIDTKGKYLVQPQYENINVDDGKFLFLSSGKWGWLDKKGNVLIKPEFEDAFPFSGKSYAAVRQGEKWGYIDAQGKMSISAKYDFAFGFDGDMALVGEKEKYGFIDRQGKYIINPQLADIGSDYFLHVFARISRYSFVRTAKNTPRHVAYEWLSSFYHLDFDGAKLLSTQDTKEMLTQFSNVLGLMPDSSKQQMMSIRVGIRDYKEEADKAVVSYTTSDNPDKQQVINLLKKDDRWKVQFSKNDMAGAPSGDSADNASNGQ